MAQTFRVSFTGNKFVGVRFVSECAAQVTLFMFICELSFKLLNYLSGADGVREGSCEGGLAIKKQPSDPLNHMPAADTNCGSDCGSDCALREEALDKQRRLPSACLY